MSIEIFMEAMATKDAATILQERPESGSAIKLAQSLVTPFGNPDEQNRTRKNHPCPKP
jgi:hypothetical protein